MKFVFLLLMPWVLLAIDSPAVEYRFDECYWMNGANGVVGDTKESISGADATSVYMATIGDDGSNPTPCNYGIFLDQNDSGKNHGEVTDQVMVDDTVTGNIDSSFTVSFWLHTRNSSFSNWVLFVAKTDESSWDYGWGFVNPTDNQSTTLRFFINEWKGDPNDNNGAKVDYDFGTLDTTHWYHIVGTYDGSVMQLYVDGSRVNSTNTNVAIVDSNEPLRMGSDYWGVPDHDMDEVKIWHSVLSDTDINTLYQNEKNGKNYDGTSRICNLCTASISTNTWELVGIPADLRVESNTSISKIFGDDMSGSYGADWRIYRRDYSDSNNSSQYVYLSDTNTELEFGTAYWLGSKKSENWDVIDMQAVDYNSTSNACTAGACVEINLKSVTHDFDIDGDDGTGPYRYYMTGFMGKKPIKWADCRIVVDGTAYTPSESEDDNYTSKTIWIYNAGGDNYVACDDTTPGGCKLVPYKGFWIELHAKSKGKNISVLIPKE